MDEQSPSLGKYVADWERNAALDPLWVILTRDKTRGKWEAAEFFATGEEEIARVLQFVAEQEIQQPRHGRFLDFGCGVGRATRALGARFQEGVGIDISERMIALAKDYCADLGPKLSFAVNQKGDLSEYRSGEFDFIYSHIVLQHMPREQQGAFITEFVRLLRPGGVAAFQVVTEFVWSIERQVKSILPRDWRRTLRRWFNRAAQTERDLSGEATIEMHPITADEISRATSHAGCHIVAAPYCNSSDPDHCGRIVFLSKEQAIDRVRNGLTGSDVLSRFFFVQKAK